MARKRNAEKDNNHSTGRYSRRPPERDPWTPWGKWLKARRERREQRRQARQARREARRKARQRRWMRRRQLTLRGLVFVGLMLLACGIGLVVQLLLGRPYPWEALRDVGRVVSASHKLEEGQARWESLAIEHYLIDIEYVDNGDTWCGPATLEIRQGRIMDTPSPGSTHWFPARTCDDLMEQLIPDHAFVWLDDQLDAYTPGETMLLVEFNAEFGYPTRAEQAVYEDEVPGCCWSVTWAEMRPVYRDD